METAQVNGAQLQYGVKGAGEPVLLIGTGPIEDSFLPLLSEQALAGSHRLIHYRQRRPTTGTDEIAPVSFEEHAKDAVDLLNHLGIRRAHLAGHSTGAAIALQLAVDRPDRVHTLTLLEPPLLGVPSAGAFFDKAAPALAAYAQGDGPGAMERFLSVVSSLDWKICQAEMERRIPGSVEQAMKNADNFFGSYLPSLQAWHFGAEQATQITQPVLSVLGAESDRLFVESHDQLRSWFPQIETHTVSGAGHLLHIQQPGLVARGVGNFLARHALTEAEAATRLS